MVRIKRYLDCYMKTLELQKFWPAAFLREYASKEEWEMGPANTLKQLINDEQTKASMPLSILLKEKLPVNQQSIDSCSTKISKNTAQESHFKSSREDLLTTFIHARTQAADIVQWEQYIWSSRKVLDPI